MHYNILKTETAEGMEALRRLFPEGRADEMNFCLFSTSGVHGYYNTIEDVEAAVADAKSGPTDRVLTFLVVHPRQVGMQYGNCLPSTPEDFAFLRKLRSTSRDMVANIGR